MTCSRRSHSPSSCCWDGAQFPPLSDSSVRASRHSGHNTGVLQPDVMAYFILCSARQTYEDGRDGCAGGVL